MAFTKCFDRWMFFSDHLKKEKLPERSNPGSFNVNFSFLEADYQPGIKFSPNTPLLSFSKG